MIVNDDWVRAAMTDDIVVVELLLRLKQSESASVSAKSQPIPTAVLPLSWGLKQPRSRLTASSRCDGAVSGRKDAADSTRCSPTTPLSWSGGASPSATGDGCEESGLNHAARSKATATSGCTGSSTPTKRSKRKKTFAELKEEESSLLKERIFLKEEIANRNATFEAERAKNESLKRMKLDIGSKSLNNPSSTCDELLCAVTGQPHQRMVPSGTPTHATEYETRPQGADSRPKGIESTEESFFLVPDLNMMPSEDDS